MRPLPPRAHAATRAARLPGSHGTGLPRLSAPRVAMAALGRGAGAAARPLLCCCTLAACCGLLLGRRAAAAGAAAARAPYRDEGAVVKVRGGPRGVPQATQHARSAWLARGPREVRQRAPPPDLPPESAPRGAAPRDCPRGHGQSIGNPCTWATIADAAVAGIARVGARGAPLGAPC